MKRQYHGYVTVAIAMGMTLTHCTYDVVFSRADSGTNTGAAGRGNSNSSLDGRAGAAGAPATVHAMAGAAAAARFLPGISWQWQLTGAIDTSPMVNNFVVDLTETTAEVFSTLRSQNKRVICHFSAGTSEAWRSDVAALPLEVRGNGLPGRSDETWLDIRTADVRSIMTKRMDLAQTRGCDGVLPDSIDGYAAATGFAITIDDALDYLHFLSQMALARNLVIGLSNAPELVVSAEPWFDFEVEVNCLKYDECDRYRPFLAVDKPVLHVEFVNDAAGGLQQLDSICDDPRRSGFSTIIKTSQLDAWRMSCD